MGAKLEPHEVPKEKSPGFDPVITGIASDRLVLPVLVRVNGMIDEVIPTTT